MVEGIPTYAPEPCPGCSIAATQAAQRDTSVACSACGATWEPEPAIAPPSAIARQGRRRPTQPRTPDARLRHVVDSLLRWHLACAQRESTGGGGYAPVVQGSPTASVLRVLETGVIGDGCSGTKGTWRGAAPEPERLRVLTVDTQTGERYRQLGDTVLTADAVIEDGFGDKLALVEVYRERTVELSLAQRIGWRLASEKQRAQWRVKIHQRDSTPALEGMATAGEKALTALLTRWDEIVAEEQREAIARECREAVGR